MIKLEEVNEKNVWKLLSLEVNDGQKDFVATNTESVVEAYLTLKAGGVALPYGIFDGEEAVGFLMIGYGNEPGWEGPKIAKGNYCLWRLMIDKEKQRKGYGRAAIAAAIDLVKTFPSGKAEAIWLSYEPENEVAKRLYHEFGFFENGEVEDGEIVAVKRL